MSCLLSWCGVQPRPWGALVRALITMDLRAQHFAKATATKPQHILSPLFLVFGQCLTLSAVVSLLLFMRVDIYFHTVVSLSLSMVVMAILVLVEFSEVVFDPRDLTVIGPRPISPATYASARLINLLFYVGLLYFALNIFPLMLGAGFRDAGVWYAPAYLVASLFGSVMAAMGVVLVLSLLAQSHALEQWKELLAWTQIVLIVVVGYGGQFMLRNKEKAFELYAAEPPEWIANLPSAWLARFVERAAVAPDEPTLWLGLGMLAGSVLLIFGTTVRLTWLYREMQPAKVRSHTRRFRANRVGALRHVAGSGLMSNATERVGYFLLLHLLVNDVNLRMRALLPLNLPVAMMIVGGLSGQFGNPMREAELARITLPVLTPYFFAVGAVGMVISVASTTAHEASWLLAAAPLRQPLALWTGTCKGLQMWVITPLCLVYGVALWWLWRDLSAALLFTGLAWSLCWLALRGTCALGGPRVPFSLPTTHGGATGSTAIPTGIASLLGGTLASIQLAIGSRWELLTGLIAMSGVLAWWFSRNVSETPRARLGEVRP